VKGDTRYDILIDTFQAVPDPPEEGLPDRDRDPAPWESRVQATCECLSWRGALGNLERRRAEDALGETVYAEFPMYTRSALVTAHSLLDKGLISEDELRAKMEEVRERFART
jgi:hypothetical protein